MPTIRWGKIRSIKYRKYFNINVGFKLSLNKIIYNMNTLLAVKLKPF